jgi:glycerol-3-phosphate dehydrogenase
MNRVEELKQLQSNSNWDLVVIGGGASGLGVALDAVSRGLKVALLEKSDFAKGTSSRSTKLLHGGVRYLAQGQISLVFEALHERGLLIKNANHLSKSQAFVIPIYSFIDHLKYGIGLKIYDWMSKRLSLGKSEMISKKRMLRLMPHIKTQGLRGGVVYYDGQFDDARLAVNVAQTIVEQGGHLANYTSVTKLLKDDSGSVIGVEAKDELSGVLFELKAKMVVNATGVFGDKILKMDNPTAKKTIQPSQGVHIVLDKKFTNSQTALMIPETSDGRVLFAVPWKESLVVGTTDTLVKKPKLEPQALQSEVDFILETAQAYLSPAPQKKDIKAVFAGLRPLAKASDENEKTKEISRSHKVIVSESGLVSLVGGKWTTFRRMGQDTVDYFYRLNGIKKVESNSKNSLIHGAFKDMDAYENSIDVYGTDAPKLKELALKQPDLDKALHPDFPNKWVEVLWAIREEMAQTVDDILSRRLRIIFQDVDVAIELAPAVAAMMKRELSKDDAWEQEQISTFNKIANKYKPL